ncbi:MAG: class I SAM-dependent methyltransferase [Acidobacteriia bacterium]|nr:class I SAM-dependent methyltransferase [Terriglobia bacterium]
MIPPDNFSTIQSLYFEAADAKRFRHQTSSPYFSETEKTLLDRVQSRRGQRLLEVGCGEGGNLFFLGESEATLFGIDLFPNKLIFARSQLSKCGFACSRADQLPFPGECFDIVLCRDVLHHLPEREATLKEISRVCRPGGKIIIIEPNGRNFIVRLQIFLIKAEAGIKCNSPLALQDLIRRETGFLPVLQFRQPFPVFRMVLHYRYGFPGLGRWRVVQRLFESLNRMAASFIPQSRWAYLIYEMEKTPAVQGSAAKQEWKAEARTSEG